MKQRRGQNTGTSRPLVQEWTVTATQQTRAHTTHTHTRTRVHHGPGVSSYRGGGTELLFALLGGHALVSCRRRLTQVAKDCPPSLEPALSVAHCHGLGPHCTLLFQMPSREGLSGCTSKASATPTEHSINSGLEHPLTYLRVICCPHLNTTPKCQGEILIIASPLPSVS